MQLMCAYSEENDTPCLGLFPGVQVRKFRSDDKGHKVPQTGWNSITQLAGPLFNGVKNNAYCYFVHSYYAELNPASIASTDYIQPYSSALQRNNFYGVQFHPEKSAQAGEQILKNFLTL